MKNKNLILAIILFLCVLLIAQLFNNKGNQSPEDHESVESVIDENSEPTADRIKKDLASKELSGLNTHNLLNVGETNYHIKEVTIDRAQIDELSDSATYWCLAVLENKMYVVEASITATYSFYEIGGWQLETISSCNNAKYTPKAGPIESVVQNDLLTSSWGEGLDEGNVSISQFKNTTDLKNGNDSVSFIYTEKNPNFTFSGIIQSTYKFNDEQGWSLESFSFDPLNYSLNERCKLLLFAPPSDSGFQYYEFGNLSEDPISFAHYAFPDYANNVLYTGSYYHTMSTGQTSVNFKGSAETAPYLYLPVAKISIFRDSASVYSPDDRADIEVLLSPPRSNFEQLIANSSQSLTMGE